MLFDEIRQATGISTYSAGDSDVLIADRLLEDFTKVTVTTTEVNRVETGLDANYTIPVALAPQTTISISVLANGEDEEYLENLHEYILTNGGFFQIVINNGGKFAGTYSAFFLKGYIDTDIDVDPQDTVFTFGAVREDKGIYSRLPQIELQSLRLLGE